MENLFIEGLHDTYFTPAVMLDATSGKCSITGESFLEEPYVFYQHIANWFKRYAQASKHPLEVDFKLSYFNTSSSRAILELIRELKTLTQSGNEITVNWHYPDPDHDEMRMEGEDFMEESGLEIHLIEYKR